MEIGRRFYPPPLVNIPAVTIPEPLRNVGYAFEAEKRARQQFDEANSTPEQKPAVAQKNPSNGVASSESMTSSTASITNEVLLPCAAPATAAPPRPPPPAPKSVAFEEFEGRGTVFDELEWRSIDDKLALSQILGNVSLLGSSQLNAPVNSTAVAVNDQRPPALLTSKSVTVPAIPSYPVLDFGTRSRSEEPTVFLNSTGEMSTAVYTKPINSAPTKEAPSVAASESPLRVRLLTKGYRQNLVDVALERLPRERLPYVEYYMKGMSILEKRGVNVEKTVAFLLDSNLSDKQAVVQRAQTAEQLLGMGFSVEEVFPALISSQGDRVKALDALLGSR